MQRRAVGTPSYWVQKLFSEHRGVLYLATSVNATQPGSSGAESELAASVTCRDEGCTFLAVKVCPSSSIPCLHPLSCTHCGTPKNLHLD